jgi:hypothetical protein
MACITKPKESFLYSKFLYKISSLSNGPRLNARCTQSLQLHKKDKRKIKEGKLPKSNQESGLSLTGE